MRARHRRHGAAALLSLVIAAGCADDSALATSPGTSTGDEPGPITFVMTGSTGEGTTAIADDTGTGTSTSAGTSTTGPADGTSTTTEGDTTTTGGEMAVDQTVSQLVSAGARTSSRSYTVIYTMGQPSTLQAIHQSSNYRVHGGLIGANGSPP